MVGCSCSDPNTMSRLPGSEQQCGPSRTQMQAGIVPSNNAMMMSSAPNQTMMGTYPMMQPSEQKKVPYRFIFFIIIIAFVAMYFMKKNSK